MTIGNVSFRCGGDGGFGRGGDRLFGRAAIFQLTVGGGDDRGDGFTRQLAQQPVVDHLAGDGRGDGAAVAAVFHHHSDGDPGVVGRGEGDEQGVVPIAQGDPSGVVALVLLHADDLGGAGLAGELVGRSGPGRRRRAARLGDLDHRLPDQLDIFGLQPDPAQDLWRGIVHPAGGRVAPGP